MSKTSRPAATRRFTCDCGSQYRHQTRRLAGIEYSLYACPNCNDTIFTLEQTKAYQAISRLVQIARTLQPLRLR